MKLLLVIAMAFSLSGCALFTKTKLVPQAYMPEPPEILMREAKDLNTIKQEQPATPPQKKEDK
jgi:hypothetical protein